MGKSADYLRKEGPHHSGGCSFLMSGCCAFLVKLRSIISRKDKKVTVITDHILDIIGDTVGALRRTLSFLRSGEAG